MAKKHILTNLNPFSPPTLNAKFLEINFFWNIFRALSQASFLNKFNSCSKNLVSSPSKFKFISFSKFGYEVKMSAIFWSIFSLSLKTSPRLIPSLNNIPFNNSSYFPFPSED